MALGPEQQRLSSRLVFAARNSRGPNAASLREAQEALAWAGPLLCSY